MTNFSKANRAISIMQMVALCSMMAAATGAQAMGGVRDPPAGVNGWKPAVAAKVVGSSATTARVLRKWGRCPC